MRNTPPNRHRNNRSNAYSGSKCSNWMRFDPFVCEIDKFIFSGKSTAKITLSAEHSIKVFINPLNESFIRPCTLAEIEQVLRTVPPPFLYQLGHLYLPGGSKKQLQVCRKTFFYGCYSCGAISLSPFPKKWLRREYAHAPPPHKKLEYDRVGAKSYQSGSTWVLEMSEASLKKFYLQDVLIHEIGHHVDWLRRSAGSKLTEEFAEWFATEYGFRRE